MWCVNGHILYTLALSGLALWRQTNHSTSMTSLQESAGAGKSLKFVHQNPLESMRAAPPSKEDDHRNDPTTNDVQRQVAKHVNERLEKAMTELQEKHRRGTQERDDPDRAPTGEAYQQQQQQQQEWRNQQQKQQQEQEREREDAVARERRMRQQVAEQLQNQNDDDTDSHSDWDDLLEEEDEDDDPVWAALREKRLQAMKQAQSQKARNLARGHGQYRTISQDEFLPECCPTTTTNNPTTTEDDDPHVVVHFCHNDFERCKIMDHHLQIIAVQHTECKFVRIHADKAPFFVTKLQIRTLPTLLVFRHGQTVNRLIGFDELQVKQQQPVVSRNTAAEPAVDEWETSRLQEWLARAGAIDYTPPTADLRDEMERLGLQSRLPVYRGGIAEYEDDV